MKSKKKITEIRAAIEPVLVPANGNIVGKLMSYLRASGNMLTYAGVAVARRVYEDDGNLVIEIDAGSEAESLFQDNHRNILDGFIKPSGMTLNLKRIEDKEQLLLERLKKLIGEDLKIIEE